MEIHQLRSFVSVAQEGHLTRAAERLCISQPAVSAHIKSLEEELGVALFLRTPRGMQLTGPGQLLLTQAEQTLASARELLQSAHRLRGELSGQVRLGAVSDPATLRLGEFLATMAAACPTLELKLSQGISGNVLAEVRRGELDAGYIISDGTEGSVTAIRLRSLSFCIAAPAAWRHRITDAGWKDIAALPWVLTPPQCSYHHILTRMFSEHAVRPARTVEADQETALINLVSAGLGLALLRDDHALAAQRSGAVVIWDGEKRMADLLFIHRRERSDDPVIRAMVSVIQQQWMPTD